MEGERKGRSQTACEKKRQWHQFQSFMQLKQLAKDLLVALTKEKKEKNEYIAISM